MPDPIAAGVFVAFDAIARTAGYLLSGVLSGVILIAAGCAAALSSVLAKRLLVGPITSGQHPLCSSFIWRNEGVDTFIEMVGAPWFARTASGSPALVWWLRGLGARIGSGVWCELLASGG